MTQKERWPGWVYGEGEEPDYRFTFANERTFLAWIRTSLALLAAAVAVDVVDLDMADALQQVLAGGLVVLGVLAAVLAWARWAVSERAIRRRRPLPSFALAMPFAVGLAVIGLVVLLLA